MNHVLCHKARRLPLLLAFVVLLSLGGTAALAGQLPALPTFDPAPPSNDNFADAKVITTLPYSDTVDATSATMEPGEWQYCAPSSTNTVWYRLTPDQDLWVELDMKGSQYGGSLNVYRADGGGIGDLVILSCGSGEPPIELEAKADVVYYFQVANAYEHGTLTVNLEEIPPPANDNFADATLMGSLPFNGSLATTGTASIEPEEPAPSCSSGSIYRTVWYAFTAGTSGSFTILAEGWPTRVLAVYTGDGLARLTEVACRSVWGGGRLTYHGDEGTTYLVQVGSYYPNEYGWLNLSLDVTPPPQASFDTSPGDPNTFDTIYFNNHSYDPADVGFEVYAWDFGDGTTSSESHPTHQYAADGDYTVKLTVTTYDGRTASTDQTVKVRTHDVAIVKLVAPNAARVGQTRPIVVSIKNTRYPERVHIRLDKSVPGGYQTVADTDQNVPVRSGNRTTSVSLSYTFAQEDAVMGKVTFKATSYLLDARDALPFDNEAISSPTKVSR